MDKTARLVENMSNFPLPMPLRFICTDFNGVYVQSLELDHEMYSMADPTVDMAFFKGMYTGNVHEHQERTGYFVPFPDELYKERLAQLMPVQGALAFLQSLQGRALDAVVVTSARTDVIQHYCATHSLPVHSVYGNDIDRKKTVKLRRILEERGAEPTETCYIGDTCGDMREAAELGIPTIGVTWGGIHNREELKEAGADYIVDSMEELEELLFEQLLTL